jgi:hypothetical protein
VTGFGDLVGSFVLSVVRDNGACVGTYLWTLAYITYGTLLTGTTYLATSDRSIRLLTFCSHTTFSMPEAACVVFCCRYGNLTVSTCGVVWSRHNV